MFFKIQNKEKARLSANFIFTPGRRHGARRRLLPRLSAGVPLAEGREGPSDGLARGHRGAKAMSTRGSHTYGLTAGDLPPRVTSRTQEADPAGFVFGK